MNQYQNLEYAKESNQQYQSHWSLREMEKEKTYEGDHDLKIKLCMDYPYNMRWQRIRDRKNIYQQSWVYEKREYDLRSYR